jgi:hypothetical protein
MVFKKIFDKITERRVNRILDKAVAEIKKGKKITDEDLTQLEDKTNGIIEVTNSGFNIVNKNRSIYVCWDNIDEIVSFKRDLWTTDLICLGFLKNQKESAIVIHEEMHGFLDLRRKIELKIPEFKERFHKWLFSTPAFDGTVFTLWKNTET